MEKIRFSDLSLALKLGFIGGMIFFSLCALYVFFFFVGFFIAIFYS